MKIKSIVLYSIGLGFLLFGNRDWWDEWQEDRQKINDKKKLYTQAEENLDLQFETQNLKYDSVEKKWSNPTLYFQLINVSYVNFDALKKGGKRTTVEKDDDENASDSL